MAMSLVEIVALGFAWQRRPCQYSENVFRAAGAGRKTEWRRRPQDRKPGCRMVDLL